MTLRSILTGWHNTVPDGEGSVMKDEDVDAAMIVGSLKYYARLAHAMPDEVQLIRDLTHEYVKSHPATPGQEVWAHVGEHMKDVLPAVFNDPRADGLGERFNAESEKLRESGPEFFAPAVIGGLAVAAAAIALIAYGAYCTHGPYPEKGESAPAHCT